MNIGERIKEERKRLGFSQTDFAALGNSSKGAQISWEKGTVYPNASVLAAWAEMGLDVVYVLTGKPGHADLDALDKNYQATCDILRKIQFLLRLGEHTDLLVHALEMAREDAAAQWSESGGSNKTLPAVKALLDKSPLLMLDKTALEDMLERLEFVLDMKKLALSPTDKARAILFLIEATKASGSRADLGMVEEAIKKVAV